QEAREKLGVPEGSLVNFAEFRRSVLEKAKKEVDQIAHFTFEWKENRSRGRGRRVEALEFHFRPKTAGKVDEAADELDRPRTGRKARREGNVENVVALSAPLTFPPSGPIDYAAGGSIADIARQHGGGWDKNMIADAYRGQMGDKLETLSGDRMLKSWEGFCK